MPIPIGTAIRFLWYIDFEKAMQNITNYILFDINIGEIDQLNLITICIRCTVELGGKMRQYAHEFYTNRCEYNTVYSEGNHEIVLLYKNDFNLFDQVSQSEYKYKIENRNLPCA